LGTPGSAPPREGFHPVLALVLVAAGVVGMYVPVVVAQIAAMTGGVHVGLRTLLVGSEAFLVLPSLAAVLLARRPLRDGLALGPIDARLAAVALCTGAALWLAAIGLLQLQSIPWPPTPEFLETFRQLHAALKPKNALDGVLSVITIALVPAVCEEIVFRGVVLPSFARWTRPAAAVVLSALVFGVIHIDMTTSGLAFTRLPFAIFVGTAFGLLRLRTRSLAPSILAHALLNTITFLTVVVTGMETEGEVAEVAAGVALLVGGSALTVMAMRHARPPLTPSGPTPRLAA
jgi:sodium transport system permease protein